MQLLAPESGLFLYHLERLTMSENQDPVKKTKSEAVRELLDENPSMQPTEIVAKLKERGMEITNQSVSGIKHQWRKMKKKKRSRRSTAQQKNSPAKPKVVLADLIALGDLIAVKKLADKMGGLPQLQEATRALVVLNEV